MTVADTWTVWDTAIVVVAVVIVIVAVVDQEISRFE